MIRHGQATCRTPANSRIVERMKPISPLQRSAIILFIVYLTFIGGTVYPQLNLVLRIFHHVLITSVLLCWLGSFIFRRRAWEATPLDLPLLLYALWLGITAIRADNTRVSLEQIWQYWVHILLFYWLVGLMRAGKTRVVLEGLFLSAGVMVIVSLAEIASWYFGLGFAGFQYGWFEIGGLRDPIPPASYRLTLGLNVSTLLGNYAAVAGLLAVGWGIATAQKDNRWGLFLLAAGLAWIVIFSESRGAMLGVIGGAGILFGFWLLRRQATERKSALPATAVGTLMIIGVLLIGALVVLITLSSARDSGDRARLDMWRSALKMTKASPVFGVGASQFGVTFRDYRDPTLLQDKLVSAHNLWLNTAAETGLVGLALLVWLMAIFARVWWQAWQAAPLRRKQHLEGIFAALLAFGIHSLVDTFTLTSVVLPVLIAVAYAVSDTLPQTRPSWVYKLMPLAAGAVTAGYFVWFASLDYAAVAYFNSMAQVAAEDYEAALKQANRAEQLDSDFGLYQIQQAYILGLLAEDDPDRYLDRAIQAHTDVLSDNPTFDLAYANLAALYAQRGDYAAAADATRRANMIHPYTLPYYMKLGEYLELSGDLEGAKQTYLLVLQHFPSVTQSDFWRAAPPNSPRWEAVEIAYQTLKAHDRAEIALNMQNVTEIQQAVSELENQLDASGGVLLGKIALLSQDYATARRWFSLAISLDDSLSEAYAGRAEANFYLRNYPEAEKDAQTAIFLDKNEGGRGYYILALLRLRDSSADGQAINDLLAKGVSPEPLEQSYATTVYGHISNLGFLPQLQVMGQGSHAYEPWLLLAERYAQDEDNETDPAEIYEAILSNDYYVQAAHEGLAHFTTD